MVAQVDPPEGHMAVNRREVSGQVVKTSESLKGRGSAVAENDHRRCHVGTSGVRRLDPDAIVRTASRAGLATDSSSTILYWNKAATDLLGYRAADVVGKTAQEVLEAKDVFGNPLCPRHCLFHEMAQSGQAPESFELGVHTNTGERVRVAVSIVVVLDTERADHTLVYLMTPIRRRRRADEAIDRLLAQTGSYGVTEGGVSHRRRWTDRHQMTDRQLEVLRGIATGRHVREIAADLGISVHTVRSHIRNIFETLEVSSQVEAVAKAMRERLI
jgi:PAS domain S-box-containing protein